MTKRSRPLGVGIIGGGFIARFHIRSWVGVRDANILGVFDPDEKRAEEACALAQGPPRRGRPSLQVPHPDDREPGHRRDLDLLAQLYPPRGHGGDRRGRRQGQGRPCRRRLREAPGPQRPRGEDHA